MGMFIDKAGARQRTLVDGRQLITWTATSQRDYKQFETDLATLTEAILTVAEMYNRGGNLVCVNQAGEVGPVVGPVLTAITEKYIVTPEFITEDGVLKRQLKPFLLDRALVGALLNSLTERAPKA
jgi:hypothetical protein